MRHVGIHGAGIIPISAMGTVPAFSQFCDDFDRANGALGAPWQSGGATWAIVSGEAVNTPTEGAELVTDGVFSTACGAGNWTCGAGWNIAAGVATHTPGNTAYLTQNNVGTVGNWFVHQITIANRTAGTITNYIGSYGSPAFATNATHLHTGRAIGNGNMGYAPSTTFDGDIDNSTVKQLTLNTLFSSVETGTADVVCQAELDTVVAGTQAGLVLNLDDKDTPANFVIAYHDGTNAKLEKCVAGTYTSVISAAAAYGAGRYLRVEKSGTSYSLYYNGVQVGTTQTISDAGIVSNTRHGSFSTYSGNQIDNFCVTRN